MCLLKSYHSSNDFYVSRATRKLCFSNGLIDRKKEAPIGSFSAKFFAQSSKVGTEGKASGESSLFKFNPSFTASREKERERRGKPSETLNFDFAGARWAESRARTFRHRIFRTF